MNNIVVVILASMAAVMPLKADQWYVGDVKCPSPKDDGTYSAPYKAFDHPNDYPSFAGSDKQGWSCSYQRDDGVIVQYGDSRTPQEQWLSVWGGSNSSNE